VIDDSKELNIKSTKELKVVIEKIDKMVNRILEKADESE